MSSHNIPNKSTFLFCNIDDPLEEIKFQNDERDHNALFHRLLFIPMGGGTIKGLLPPWYENINWLLSIKDDIGVFRAIVTYMEEPIVGSPYAINQQVENRIVVQPKQAYFQVRDSMAVKIFENL